MKEFDFEMLQDEACDKAISYVLSSGFEDVTAVDLMYGSESAYIDDSFIAKVKRGIRNITTFRTATKIKNLAKDIERLSKEKISQGPTDGININYEMFQNMLKFMQNRANNITKILPMMEELRDMLKEIEGNKELVAKLGQMDLQNGNRKTTIFTVIFGAIHGYFLNQGLKDMNYYKGSKGPYYGLSVAQVAISSLALVITAFSIARTAYKMIKGGNLNKDDKDTLVLKELQSKFEGVLNQTSKIVKTLIGINPASNSDISQQVKAIADKERVEMVFNASLLEHTQQVSYEEKVKIVDELKAFSAVDLENILNLQGLKQSLTIYNKIASKLKTSGFLSAEGETTLNNANIIAGYLLASTDIVMLSLQGVLEDAKKY